jgi:tight adherence protein C
MDHLISLLTQFFPDPGILRFVFVIIVATAVFSLAMAVLFLLAGLFDPLQSRLRKLTGEDRRKKPWLANASDALKPLTQYVEPKQSSKDQNQMRAKLIHAGFRQPNAVSMFYALKVIFMAVLLLGVMAATMFLPKLNSVEIGYLIVLAGAVGFMVPNILLGRLIRQRQRRLRHAFPDALDLLVVCTEAGLGLKSAIQRVSDEMVVSHEELANELGIVNAEMRAGVESIDALRNLVERTGLAEIRGLVVMLSQSMRFGTSVAETLRIYAEEFRDKRMQAAEEMAAKLSIKLLFPLALCFLPAFMIVGVGPVVIGVMAVFR